MLSYFYHFHDLFDKNKKKYVCLTRYIRMSIVNEKNLDVESELSLIVGNKMGY